MITKKQLFLQNLNFEIKKNSIKPLCMVNDKKLLGIKYLISVYLKLSLPLFKHLLIIRLIGFLTQGQN